MKPYLCVACEKVIVDKNEVPSLIGLFNRIAATKLPGINEIPKNYVIPKDWTIFSAWDFDPGEEQKEYFQHTEILYPDKSLFGEPAKIKLIVEAGKRSQNNVQLDGFPMGQVGKYTVRTWLEEGGKIVYEPIEFHISVEVGSKEQGS